MSPSNPTPHVSDNKKNSKTKITTNSSRRKLTQTQKKHTQTTLNFTTHDTQNSRSTLESLETLTQDFMEYSSTTSNPETRKKTTLIRPSITIRQTKDTDQAISPDNTNHNERLLRTQRQFTQIKLNTLQTDNLPFGDDISEPHDGETIIFHNINGIKDMTNWFQILMTMTELNIDIFGFAEINQKMDNGEKYQWTDQIRKHF
jgi:hypothetical protein